MICLSVNVPDLIAHLRQLTQGTAVPVIAIVDIPTARHQQGAEIYLPRPVSYAQLRAHLLASLPA